MTPDQQIYSKIYFHDWTIFIIVLLLIFIGVIAIQSATVDSGSPTMQKNFKRQIIWAGIGLIIYFSVSLFNFRMLYAISYLILLSGIFLIILTYLPTISTGASGRWIGFGGLSIQPSELMKVFLVVGLARLLTDNIKNLHKP